jgi:addiction module RelE/StbE family toxin
MKYKVEFLQTALDDLEEIILHIAKDNKTAAMKLHDKIIAAAYRLETFPKLGITVPDKKMRDGGFHMLIIEKYILFYKIYGDTINILRLAHGARDYPILFERQSQYDTEGI